MFVHVLSNWKAGNLSHERNPVKIQGSWEALQPPSLPRFYPNNPDLPILKSWRRDAKKKQFPSITEQGICSTKSSSDFRLFPNLVCPLGTCSFERLSYGDI